MIMAAPDFLSRPMASFAQCLRYLHSARNLTQARLAEPLQIRPLVYSRWARGHVAPQSDTVVRIAELLEGCLDDSLVKRSRMRRLMAE